MRTCRGQIFLPDDPGPTGRGVRVAVIDTGIDHEHPDFAGRIETESSTSFSSKDDNIDRNGHGTHVAGIIGGSGAASEGFMRGIAPQCTLIALKVAETSTALQANAIAAFDRAMDLRVDVINFSSGYAPDCGPPPWIWPMEPPELEKMARRAADQGILTVVASGNSGPDYGSVTLPGICSSCLTVGAVDASGMVLSTSSRGPVRRSSQLRRGGPRRFDAVEHSVGVSSASKPDLVAPGVINAPRPRECAIDGEEGDTETRDPMYFTIRGSSQATAVVSGLAALAIEMIRARNLQLGPDPSRSLRRLFTHAAAKLQAHDQFAAGAGLIMWPNLAAVIQDFDSDPQFRNVILDDGEGPRLI